MIPYGRQLIEEDDIAAVVQQLRSDWLTQGPMVAKFEESLCELTSAKYAVAVSSGTAALHLAALAAGMKANDVGLTSDVTFVASANCMRYANASPVLVDVDPSTGHLSLDALKKVVATLKSEGRSPKVIVPVDFSGSVSALESVRSVADSVGAVVIEDAAHSLGATYTAASGQVLKAGSCRHAQMAILSFHPVKHITTGEGGAIVTNDEGLFKTLLELRTHGITKDPAKLKHNHGPWYYEQQSLGYHYRITDVQCALGVSQSGKLDRFVARRRAIAAKYDAVFRSAPFDSRLVPLSVPKGVSSAYHLYVVRLVQSSGETLDRVAARRRRLYDGLRERGIAPQVHYIPIHTQPDFLKAGFGGGEFPGADSYYAGCLSLPMFPSLTDNEVDQVVNAVGEVLSTIRE